jgi:hypothetical protein
VSSFDDGVHRHHAPDGTAAATSGIERSGVDGITTPWSTDGGFDTDPCARSVIQFCGFLDRVVSVEASPKNKASVPISASSRCWPVLSQR